MIESIKEFSPSLVREIKNLVSRELVGTQSSSGGLVAYNEIQSNASVTHTSEGTADTVVSGTSTTYSGSPVALQFYAPNFTTSGSNGIVTIVLLDSSTVVGQIGMWVANPTAGTNAGAINCFYRFTPSAGTHTYNIAAFVSAGTASIKANSGGSGNVTPTFLRITSDV